MWRCLFLSVGHDGYRDGQQMHDGSTPTGRERPSSMQGMDMASLPPRKRPWQDGPGTGDPRDHESERPDGGERRFFLYVFSVLLCCNNNEFLIPLCVVEQVARRGRMAVMARLVEVGGAVGAP